MFTELINKISNIKSDNIKMVVWNRFEIPQDCLSVSLLADNPDIQISEGGDCATCEIYVCEKAKECSDFSFESQFQNKKMFLNWKELSRKNLHAKFILKLPSVVENCSVNVENGDVIVSGLTLRSLILKTTNGDIRVRLASDCAIEARTINGDLIKKSVRSCNDSENVLQCISTNGDIHLSK